MTDFIFIPSADAVGDFSNAQEFEGLDPTESANTGAGTFDIYEKIVSGHVVTEVVAPPVFTTQPSFGQASYTEGETVTFDEGVAGNGATITITAFTSGGVDKSGELSGTSWDTTGEAAGTISATFTASNGTAPDDVVTITADLVAASSVAALTIDLVAQGAPRDPVDLEYTISADSDVDFVLFDESAADPTAAQMAGGGAYTFLGGAPLTVVGTDIPLTIPSGLFGDFQIAGLPAGGGDGDVTVSPVFNLDTRDAAASSITPVFIDGANTAGAGGTGSTKNLTLDMTSHASTDKLLVVAGAFGGPSGFAISSLTVDGQSSTLNTVVSAGVDGVSLAYALLDPATFAASSAVVAQGASGFRDIGVVAFSVPPTATAATLQALAQTVRAGSTLQGAVAEGDAVVVAQLVSNGSVPTFTGATADYVQDIRSGEEFGVASASDLTADAAYTVTVTGTNVSTTAIMIGVS